jgi:hypothetical protein
MKNSVDIKQFGKDHWSVFAYIESCCVDNGGIVNIRHMRCDFDRHPGLAHMIIREKYPTRLKGYFEHKNDPAYIIKNHDDWDCAYDLEKEGLVRMIGTGVNPVYKLTALGKTVAGRLRAYKASGGNFATFEVGSL